MPAHRTPAPTDSSKWPALGPGELSQRATWEVAVLYLIYTELIGDHSQGTRYMVPRNEDRR